ncbi:unnamed protein product, partial [marine sediment metagenome]
AIKLEVPKNMVSLPPRKRLRGGSAAWGSIFYYKYDRSTPALLTQIRFM